MDGYRLSRKTADVMENSVFWNMMPCSPLKINRRFGWVSRFAYYTFTLVSCLAYSSTLKMEIYKPPKSPLPFNGPYCVLAQNTELFREVFGRSEEMGIVYPQFRDLCLIALLLHTYSSEYWPVTKQARRGILLQPEEKSSWFALNWELGLGIKPDAARKPCSPPNWFKRPNSRLKAPITP
jgi:hypothetical protein